MKTARFSSVVEAAGKPEVYLLLSDPKDDAGFQRALKAGRVMTILGGGSGGKKEHAAFGYHEKGQVLIFPKSVKRFAEAQVVGIKYELLQDAPEPSPRKKAVSKKIAPPRPKRVERKKSRSPAKPAPAQPATPRQPKPAARKTEPRRKAEPKVIPFHRPTKPGPEDDDDSEEVVALKATVRRALKALEDGKQVAAFNLLQRIVEP